MCPASDRPGEFALIAELFAPLAAAGAFGLKDDAALATPPPGYDLIVTADAIVEGVHFFRDDPPELVAKKALRVNLSDLAAKGCSPAGYLMALAIPAHIGMDWLRRFARGLGEDQTEFGIGLLGGDTTATPGPLIVAITAFGRVATGSMVRRAGAKPADLVFVSGTIGDARAGLALLKDDSSGLNEAARAFLVRRFQAPEPRLALGRNLPGLASASIDVSDGLLADLGHVAGTSNVCIVVEAERLPLSQPLLQFSKTDTFETAIRAATAGDEYEIAFTCAPANAPALLATALESNTAVTEIGRVEAGRGVVLLDRTGAELPISRKGYEHFR